jgi:hypothetical protein
MNAFFLCFIDVVFFQVFMYGPLQRAYEWPVSNVSCVTFTWFICSHLMNVFVLSDFNISTCLAWDSIVGTAIAY